jgi:hypothetical protein
VAVEGQRVILSGLNAMDKDDCIATYQWRQILGPTVALTDAATVEAAFMAPGVTEAGVSLTFELAVTDSSGAMAKDTCIVNITGVNQVPTADAGENQAVSATDAVQLMAVGSSDPDGDLVAYQWVQLQGPTIALANADTAQATFMAPYSSVQGASLLFELTVTDKGGLRGSDTCMVTIEVDNAQPVAYAGGVRQVRPGEKVMLDGSASMDPDGAIAGYQWKQIGGKPVVLSDTGAAQPVLMAPEAAGEILTFQLTVTDMKGLQSLARCQVIIRN